MEDITNIMKTLFTYQISGSELHKLTRDGVEGSQFLEIRDSVEAGGRGMFTTKEIAAGEEVLRIDSPQFCIPSKEVCDNCLHSEHSGVNKMGRLKVKGSPDSAVKTLLCTGCKHVQYCSKECQRAAWKKHHKFECKNLQQLGDFILNDQHYLTLRILLLRMNGRISDELWAVILSLEAQSEGFDELNLKPEVRKCLDKIKSISGSQLPQRDIDLMMHRVLLNCFAMTTIEGNTIATMLHPFASFINHSCDPAMFYFWNGKSFCMRSARDVPKDGELSICYLPLTRSFNLRQMKLYACYGFDCRCSRCKKEAQIIASGPETDIVKIEALPGVDVLQLDLLDNFGPTLLESPCGTLQEGVMEAAREISTSLKNTLPNIEWPECMEPIPSLHCHLIDLHLMSGNAAEAFKNALRTCFIHDREVFHQPVDFSHSLHLLTLLQASNAIAAKLQGDTADLSPDLKSLKLLNVELPLLFSVYHRRLLDIGQKAWGEESLVLQALKALYEEQQNSTLEEIEAYLANEGPKMRAIRARRIRDAEKTVMEWAGLLNPLTRSIFLTGVE